VFLTTGMFSLVSVQPLRIRMTFPDPDPTLHFFGSGSWPLKIEVTQPGPEKSGYLSLSYDTTLYQALKGLKLSSPVPGRATRRRPMSRRQKRTTAKSGSGSRSEFAYTDPDPAKSHGSGSATLSATTRKKTDDPEMQSQVPYST